MSAAIFLAELEHTGIRLRLDGLYVVADVLPDAGLHLYLDLIMANKPALIAELTPLDAEIITSEAGRCSLEGIGQRIARIQVRVGTTKELGADRLALRYWRAIDRYNRERERAGIQSSGNTVVEPVTSSTHRG